ncbi:hypothetical protein DZD52_01235 [Xanthomonas nasturtii]|uniref:Uncharacterized protein n=1 Tax=Xanthomonas nasturtii TaxID=1843581 RepID=A0A3E1KSD6_9XANT|nr:hypothetical protein DZD52_01235 [Xanthomonas nasturtii]
MRVRAKPRVIRPEWLHPYPLPNPRSAPRPAPAARALQGTHTFGAQAVPCRPEGRGALSRTNTEFQIHKRKHPPFGGCLLECRSRNRWIT